MGFNRERNRALDVLIGGVDQHNVLPGREAELDHIFLQKLVVLKRINRLVVQVGLVRGLQVH